MRFHRRRSLVHHRGLRCHLVRPRLSQHFRRQRCRPGAASSGRGLRLHPVCSGLFNASLFAASILPLSTAYTVCEGLGFESGVGLKFGEAPVFYWLYTALIAAGAGVILVPNLPLVKITILSQVVNGAVLPFVLVFMLLLINNKDLMGEYVNSRAFNAIAWGTTVLVTILTFVLVWQSLKGGG